MVGKSGSRGHASKISSAASPAAVSSATQSSNKSSILRSAFSPSEYQLALFASVIHGLDAQHLRIHDTNTGRLQSEHAVNPKETITSLDWGYHDRARDQHSNKKRKRSSGVNGAVDAGDVVVAFGTSASDIRMYSPDEDKIVSTLSGGHERGVRDFKFTANKPAEGWSIGGDGKLVQWDLRTGRSMRVVSLPATSISALARPVLSEPPVLCASQTPYIIHVDTKGSVSFDAMRNSVHTLIPSSSDLSTLSGSFLAADNDRYINIFDSEKRKLLGSLVADKEVDSLSISSSTASGKDDSTPEHQTLAVITQDGSIEIFDKPFHKWGESRSSDAVTSLKAQRKKMTRRADASLRIVRPDKTSTAVPVVTASFQGPDIVVAMAEGGVNLNFDRIRWKDVETNELILRGSKDIVKAKSTSSAVMNGVKDIGKRHVDESRAIVEQGGLAQDIIMSDNENDAPDSSDDEELNSDNESKAKKPTTKKALAPADKDTEMEDAEDSSAEPSFGEILRANASAPIDVEAELADTTTNPQSLSTTKPTTNTPNTALQIPTGVSLATVLSQSLRTNDNTLLESCFHTTDTNIVRTTIQRMDSSLAGTLLQRLAERLSNRPGRYGHLLVWVQWTCVAHGGAIAGKADILRKMSSLFKVMDQRSSSLSSLLLLKGKLDMLDAQLGLRQALQTHPGAGDSEDEENVIYVEGQDDDEDSVDDEDVVMDDTTTIPIASSSSRKIRKRLAALEGDEEDDESLPLTINGVASDSDLEDDDAEDDENLIDNEAEESAGSDDEEDQLDGDEDEDEEDDDEEEGSSMVDFIQDSEEEDSDDDGLVAPQPPPAKKARKGGRR
ncbi:Small subunit (SSU) processome component [Arachnomyces sp. PD_36]|nr:Small subunit (SSU) processome component [Arachnomyces sp. PD_36]